MNTDIATTSSSGEGAETPTEAVEAVGSVTPPVEGIDTAIDTDAHTEGFILYAKQVLHYNGDDRIYMWQMFCQNFSGMMRWVRYQPDMNLLSFEQQLLLEAQISR